MTFSSLKINILLLQLVTVFICFDAVTSFTLSSKSVARYGTVHMARSLCMNAYDYDVIIIGCGVGGHGAALHARANGLKTAVLTGKDVGGTCVNRGCVPSKALLAASGRIREMKDSMHLKSFGITVGDVSFDRAGVAAHASQLANRVKVNLESSLKSQGCSVLDSKGSLTSKPNEVLVESEGKVITAKNIILAPGSVPFVPRGVQVDEKTVFTSDGGLKLEFVPQYVAIIGSGYIGLEFSDVYTVSRGVDCSIKTNPKYILIWL